MYQLGGLHVCASSNRHARIECIVGVCCQLMCRCYGLWVSSDGRYRVSLIDYFACLYLPIIFFHRFVSILNFRLLYECVLLVATSLVYERADWLVCIMIIIYYD